MNKKGTTLFVISALALSLSSYTYPEFSFDLFGKRLWEVNSLDSLKTGLVRTCKVIATSAVVWTGYAVKQWVNVRQLLQEVKECCKVPAYDVRSRSNPHWVVKGLTVNQLRNRLLQDQVVQDFIAIDNSRSILEKEQTKIKHLMNQLERYTSVERMIEKIAEQENIDLKDPLSDDSIARLNTYVNNWLETPLNANLEWQWTGFGSSIKYISNIFILSRRITSKLYKPFEKKAVRAYWRLWKKNQQFIALADRMNA